MWTELKLPKINSPIRACSVPENGDSLAVWTDEGVFRVRLHPSPALYRMHSAKEAEKKWDDERGMFVSHGNIYRMHGDCGRHGWRIASHLRFEHPHGFSVRIDGQHNTIEIIDATKNVRLCVDSHDVKGRLLVASFSGNFSHGTQSPYFVVCDQTSLRVFRYSAPNEGIPSKWSVNASPQSRESLWNAIIENPDDDTPRLIYADWLEEHGDGERAEFIRLQCRIAERESREFIPPDDPDRVLNDQYEAQHGERWSKETGEIKGIRFQPSSWRGFSRCEIVSASLATRTKQQQNILNVNPLESVYLPVIRSTDIDRLEKWDLLSRCRNLAIHAVMDEIAPHSARLIASPRLMGLRSVSFGGWYAQDVIVTLASNRPLPQLHTVLFFHMFRNDNTFDFSVLGGSQSLPQLKNVVFHHTSENLVMPERKDIRELARRVENVFQVVWNRHQIGTVTRLKA